MPTLEQIQKVDRYRTALEAWWPWATDYYGSLDTTLSGCGTGTLACAGKQSQHCFAADGDEDAAEIIETEIAEIELACAKDEKKCTVIWLFTATLTANG
jgi:predicted RNA methylase